jgi:serine/threonine protein kinase/WD40 repeat protein
MMLSETGILGQGQMIGRYRLLQLYGQGNVGEVWRAEDTTLQRQVALKVLPAVLREEKAYLHFFVENAQAAASLEHPHILPVHDFGEFALDDEILTYLVMPWISGGSLRERLRQMPAGELLPLEERFQYLRQTAEAIDYAHMKNILHRNITPGNLLLQDRTVYLTDFTLARLLSVGSYRSHNSLNASTPEYMAPELIQGHASAASDRYSLAVIAYELFTGRSPFWDADPIAVLLKQLNEAPPLPRELNPEIPALAAQTLLRGLAKSEQERPSASLAFVAELEHNWYLRTTDLADPEATVLAPWSKYLLDGSRPQPARSGAQPANQDQAEGMGEPEILALLPTISTKLIDEMGPKRRKWDRRTLLLGAVASGVLLAGGGLALGSVLLRTLKRVGPLNMIAGIPLLKLTGHQRGGLVSGGVWNVRWHPSGRYLVSAGDDHSVMLWDVGSLLSTKTERTRTINLSSLSWQLGSFLERNAVDWSPDGKMLVALAYSARDPAEPASNDTIATINPFSSGTQLTVMADQRVETTSPRYDELFWSPTGEMLATTRSYLNGIITLWTGSSEKLSINKSLGSPPANSDTTSLDDKNNVRPPIGPYRGIAMCWSQDGTRILQIDQDFSVLSWDVKSGQKTKILALSRRSQELPDQPGVVGEYFFPALKRSPGTMTQFVANNVDVAVVFDVQQKKVLHTLGTTDRAVYRTTYIPVIDSSPVCPQIGALAWSPDGRYLAGCYLADQRIFVWDLRNQQPRLTADGIQLPDLVFGGQGGHSAAIFDLAWSPDGRYLASASMDVTVIIWKVDSTS